MANEEHLKILRQGVEVWNAWRDQEPSIRPHLEGADLREADLRDGTLVQAYLQGAQLGGADLSCAKLFDAHLGGADLAKANLQRASLLWADLGGARLPRAALTKAELRYADLMEADLRWADLRWADLGGARLDGAKLQGADLRGADLTGADLGDAILDGANLTKANLSRAILVESSLVDAILTDCRIYGISAWGVKLSAGTNQQGLIITPVDQPAVTVDDLEVAQFVYLLLHNEKIRKVIDTVTSKVVLILGRFTPERKVVLDAIRNELRNRHCVPILFDFDLPAGRDITETVSLLARMARFIIADLTEPTSIPKELEAIVPHLAAPVQPLLEGERPYSMFKDYWKYEWVLPVHRYDGLNSLLATLAEKVIAPAEAKTNELAEKRRLFEAELTKPR